MSKIEKDETDYQAYEIWKGWQDFFVTSADFADYYTQECAGFNFEDARILEIGFGSGTFLNWAQRHGAHIAGTEMNPKLTQLARDKGVDVLPRDLGQSKNTHENQFDAVFAFDVFEHLTLPQIEESLDAIETMLKPEGLVFLRFPNGRSPFGLPSQHGDPTHVTALSDKIFDSLLVGRGFKIVRYAGAARIRGRGLKRKTLYALRYFLRDRISSLLNFVYAMDIEWDPVVTLVLKKQSAPRSNTYA